MAAIFPAPHACTTCTSSPADRYCCILAVSALRCITEAHSNTRQPSCRPPGPASSLPLPPPATGLCGLYRLQHASSAGSIWPGGQGLVRAASFPARLPKLHSSNFSLWLHLCGCGQTKDLARRWACKQPAWTAMLAGWAGRPTAWRHCLAAAVFALTATQPVVSCSHAAGMSGCRRSAPPACSFEVTVRVSAKKLAIQTTQQCLASSAVLCRMQAAGGTPAVPVSSHAARSCPCRACWLLCWGASCSGMLGC